MISWDLKYYNELSIETLYIILRLRQQVFIIEQNCNYLDADDIDQNAYHLMGFLNNELVAYMRIVKPGYLYEELSFGRILIKKKYRGEGFGRELMTKAIQLFSTQYQPIVIAAQLYLLQFYKDFHFTALGEEYLEDNIPHIKMMRNG